LKHRYILSDFYFPWITGIFILIILGVVSCADTDHPLPVIPDPELQTITINTSGLATHYYSLGQKKIISSNKITDWDLRFCSQSDKYYIYLNTAKHMRIAKYDGNFQDNINPSKISSWQWDILKDGKALTSLGGWGDFSFTNPKSFGLTYVIDLGYLNYFQEFGYRKITVLGFMDNQYLLKFGLLNDPDGDTIKIEKNPAYNSIYLSLVSTGKVVKIEPPITDWDLVFTQYGFANQVFNNGKVIDTAYQWTDAILLNNEGRQLASDTTKKFDDITFWDAEKYVYSSHIDFILNKWRFYNTATNRYEISGNNIYILKNNKNHMYKIELLSVDKTNPFQTVIGFKVKNL